MAKHRLIELALVLVIIGVSFWNVKQQQEAVSLRESVVALNEDNKELVAKEEKLIYENKNLVKQVTAASDSLKIIQKQYTNSGQNNDLTTEFVNFVSRLFEVNLNFTPENYEDSKQKVSSYLSDELNKEYFGQSRNTYQDANDTFSKLESVEVYPKSVQNDEMNGLVVVYHKSKKSDQDWIKGMNIFEVSYSIELKKVTKIINLGNGYSYKN